MSVRQTGTRLDRSQNRYESLRSRESTVLVSGSQMVDEAASRRLVHGYESSTRRGDTESILCPLINRSMDTLVG